MKAEYQKLAILLKQIHTADHAGVEAAAQHSDKKTRGILLFCLSRILPQLRQNRTTITYMQAAIFISAFPFLWLYLTSLFSIKCFIRQPQKMLHKKQPTCILQLLQFVSLFFVLRCCFQHSAELQFACLSRESLGFTWLWTFVWLTLGTQENVSWQRIKQNKSFCGKLIVNLILLFPL